MIRIRCDRADKTHDVPEGLIVFRCPDCGAHVNVWDMVVIVPTLYRHSRETATAV